MSDQDNTKRRRLQEAGLLHQNPDKVLDPMFLEHPEFFDAHDLLQVRYELLRAHLIDKEAIAGICKRYGISRQTFYTLLEKFTLGGTAGLLPGKPGPRGPFKLTDDVLAFVEQELQSEPGVFGSTLTVRIQKRFGILLNKRTIERLLGDLRSKKKL